MFPNFLDFHLAPDNREVRDIPPLIEISLFFFFKKLFQFLIIIEYLVKIPHILFIIFPISRPALQLIIFRVVLDVIDNLEDVLTELHVLDVFDFLDFLSEIVLHLGLNLGILFGKVRDDLFLYL